MLLLSDNIHIYIKIKFFFVNLYILKKNYFHIYMMANFDDIYVYICVYICDSLELALFFFSLFLFSLYILLFSPLFEIYCNYLNLLLLSCGFFVLIVIICSYVFLFGDEKTILSLCMLFHDLSTIRFDTFLVVEFICS